MARYRAGELPVYLCNEGRMVAPGEEFTFDGPKGETWVALDEDKPARGRKAVTDQSDD